VGPRGSMILDMNNAHCIHYQGVCNMLVCPRESQRAEAYIETDAELNLPYWRKRGVDDALAERPQLFKRTRHGGVYGVGDVPDDWTQAGEQARGAAYLAGYEAAS
jgi:hypothetical protein